MGILQASPAWGAEVMMCRYNDQVAEYSCVVKASKSQLWKVGDEVAAVGQRADTEVAETGRVLKVKGMFALVRFEQRPTIVGEGSRAEKVADQNTLSIDWKHVFTNSD